jgi:hypothetical protein
MSMMGDRSLSNTMTFCVDASWIADARTWLPSRRAVSNAVENGYTSGREELGGSQCRPCCRCLDGSISVDVNYGMRLDPRLLFGIGLGAGEEFTPSLELECTRL